LACFAPLSPCLCFAPLRGALPRNATFIYLEGTGFTPLRYASPPLRGATHRFVALRYASQRNVHLFGENWLHIDSAQRTVALRNVPHRAASQRNVYLFWRINFHTTSRRRAPPGTATRRIASQRYATLCNATSYLTKRRVDTYFRFATLHDALPRCASRCLAPPRPALQRNATFIYLGGSMNTESEMDRRDCIYPDCLAVTDFGSACEHSYPHELKYKTKPKPYSRGCLAREVPGASCQSPNCDC
jgi:hypothetical protein